MDKRVLVKKGNMKKTNLLTRTQCNKPRKKNRRFINRTQHRRLTRLKKKTPVTLFKNFSSLDFGSEEVDLLQKGGSFVPLPKQVNMTGVEVSARKFERKCLWKYWFFSHPDATSEPPHPIFQRPPKTNIPPDPPPKPLSDFVSAIRSELVGTKPRRVRPNFTKSSMENFEELIRLQKQGHLVIVPCDKTGGFAAYNRNEYIEKMMEILRDSSINSQGRKCNHYVEVGWEEVIATQLDISQRIARE